MMFASQAVVKLLTGNPLNVILAHKEVSVRKMEQDAYSVHLPCQASGGHYWRWIP